MSRQIAIKLSRLDGSRVSLPTFARTLTALQSILVQVGEMHHKRQAPDSDARPSPGRSKQAVTAACELRVARLSSRSAEAVLELPPQEPTLPLDETPSDLGVQALETTRELSAELTNSADWERVQRLIGEGYWDLVLRSYRNLCPTSAEHSEVELTWAPDTPRQEVFRLGADVRTRVQILRVRSSPEDTIEERQFIGRLNVLQADPRQCTLDLRDGRTLPFAYDPDLSEQLREYWNEQVVLRAICRVVRDNTVDDRVVEIKDVSSITLTQDTPLVIDELAVPEGSVTLETPMEVQPSFSDNLVSFEYEPLGILAYGQTHEEAAEAFREELSLLWVEYAQARDECLSEGARRLKRTLRDLAAGGQG